MKFIYSSIYFLFMSINGANCFSQQCRTSFHSVGRTYEDDHNCPLARSGRLPCMMSNYLIFCVGNSISSIYTSESHPTIKSITLIWTASFQIPPAAFREYSNLVTLDISYGPIKQIQPGAFERLNMLKDLRLTNHALQKIPTDVFNSLSSLTTLNLTNDKLNTIETNAFVGLISLQNLYLSNNNISDTTELQNVCETLTILDLSYNGISNLTSFRNFEKLHTLYLNNNKIADISSGIFTNISIRVLALQDNLIKRLDSDVFAELITLADLNLSSNDLYQDGRFPIGLVRNNKFLESLNISKTNLKVLPVGAFTGLERLLTLDLSHNNLSNIPEANLHNLKELTKFYINNNCFNHFEYDGFKKLVKINLNDNPWNCDSLLTLVGKFNQRVIISGSSYTSTNILGIDCSEVPEDDDENMNDIISNVLNEQYQNFSTEIIYEMEIKFKELFETLLANFTTRNLASSYMPNSTNMQDYEASLERFDTSFSEINSNADELTEIINKFNNTQKLMPKICLDQQHSHSVTVLLSSVLVMLLIMLVFIVYITYLLITLYNAQKCQISQLPLHDYGSSPIHTRPLLQNQN